MGGEFWLGVLSAVIVAAIIGLGRAVISSARPVITYEHFEINCPTPEELRLAISDWLVAERFIIRNRGVRHLKEVRLSCDVRQSNPWLLKVERATSVDPSSVSFQQEGERLVIGIPDLPRAEQIVIHMVYLCNYPYSIGSLKGGSSAYRLTEARNYSSQMSSRIALGFAIVWLVASIASIVWLAAGDESGTRTATNTAQSKLQAGASR